MEMNILGCAENPLWHYIGSGSSRTEKHGRKERRQAEKYFK